MESSIAANGSGAGEALSRLPLLESIVENANDAILVTEAEPVNQPGPRIVYANASFLLMSGYSAEEILGKTPRILQGPGSERATLDKIRAALEAWRPVRVEILNYRKSGEEFWVELDIVPVANEKGWFTHWVSVQRDVTERKREEQKRLRDEERFRSALGRHASDFVAIVEADGSIRYLTPSVVEVLSHRPEEMVGADVLEYVHPEDAQRARRAFSGVARTPGLGKPLGMRARSKDGSWLHLEVVGNNLLEDSSVRGIVLNVWDVTERREAEEALRASEVRHRAVVDTASDAIITMTADSVIESINAAAEHAFGYPAEEAVGRPLTILMPERFRAAHEAGLRRYLSTGEARVIGKTVELAGRRKDGAEFPIELAISEMRRGEDPLFVGIIRDVTERKRVEETLRESERRFRQLFEQSVDALLVHDREGRMVDCNSEACRSLGYSREELLSLNVRDFATNLVSEKENRRIKDGTLWERVLAGEPAGTTGFHIGEHRRKDGSTFPVEVGVGGIDHRGERLVFATARDVTERRAFEERLEYQAFHDSLTDLPNRSLLMERLQHALDRLRSGRLKREEAVAVLFMDLDNFKVVNDSLGHKAGDHLLVEAAGRIRSCLRPGDTIARLGGDEFVVLLENLAADDTDSGAVDDAGEGDEGGGAAEVAIGVAERIREALDVPFDIDAHEALVTASIGMVISSPGEDCADEFLRDADLAMYAAKKKGKDRYAVFDPSMGLHALERLKLETDLRRALDGNEFVVYYQPKVSLATGEVVGTEALVRWEHPERGLVSPAEFIPIAEETGLIVPLGLRVLREACRQAHRWHEDYPSDPPLKMAVNLSARQFRQPDLVEDVERVLRETGANPTSLILEITEGVLMEDAPATVSALDRLKRLGVGISVDDFGTGYSSLSYLKSFPVDYLKIDRSFVESLEEGVEGEGIVTATIALAHTLGLKAVAEGVETGEQLTRLRELGCDLAQGYHLARPSPSEAVSNLLASRRR